MWEEAGGGLLCEHLDVFSGTWPTCGMTRAGTAYALPTWAHRTAGIGSSSTPTLPTPRATRGGSSTETVALLPTPTANVGRNGGAQHPDKRRSGGHSVSIQDVAEFKLLPTARASTGMGGLLRPHASNTTRLGDAVGVFLLPTPRATDGTKGGPGQRGSSGDLMLPSAVHLLPTPSVADGLGGHATRSGPRSSELLLPGVAKAFHDGALLPTPTSQDSVSSGGHWTAPSLEQALELAQGELPREFDTWEQVPGHSREQADNGSLWGKYAPAIERWARTIHRDPPPPTEPGKKGGRRLSPKFVEWMQGLPAGHVTNVPGISHNDQLKALGNGVVPQQVAATTRAFLADTGWSP